jgi:ATP-dependent Lon protease
MFEKALNIPPLLPIHPMREQVMFPHMVFPLFVQAEAMPMVDEAMRGEHLLGLVACFGANEPCRFNEFSRIGTLCRINQIFRFPEGGCKVVVEGLRRIRVRSFTQEKPFHLARVEVVEEQESRGLVSEAMVQSVNALLKIALAYGRPLPGDVLKMIDQIEEAGRLADLVAVYLNLPLKDQQRILEILDPLERLKEVYLHLTSEVQKLQVRGEVQSEVAKRLGKTQKEYLLREQMRQIQEELGDEDPRQSELNEFRKRIAQAEMPEAVRTVAEKELARLERINPASPEYTVARTYLEYLCTVPWNRGTEDALDINRAQQVLDEDHYNLKEVKERILEYLAVRSLRATTKGPILCFVGPPGVGKTSLGQSIARAMGRKFIRISLGGMKDEAEIRGHRRTYIGAMPGRIIQEICRAEANNPVFMLDEVDKIGQDFRGDPSRPCSRSSTPSRTGTFADHYLDVPFDLSRVMFITTANILDPFRMPSRTAWRSSRWQATAMRKTADRLQVPPPQAARRVRPGDRSLPFEEAAMRKIIQDYTREAGVRNLERQIAAICRKVAKEITQRREPVRQQIRSVEVEELLGPRRFFIDVAAEEDRVGVATGLAWTESGGDILFVEASRMAGKKDLLLTGSLGEVMQESAKTALSFVRAHAAEFGIEPDFYEKSDLHIHVPSGAIPKDGPSAGITIATALISLLSGRPARRDVAMTGELTLSGRILPIGGIKEKVLAARRARVTTILLPARNRDNLKDIDEHIQSEMTIVFVDSMQEVLARTLLGGRNCRSRENFDSSPSAPLTVSS